MNLAAHHSPALACTTLALAGRAAALSGLLLAPGLAAAADLADTPDATLLPHLTYAGSVLLLLGMALLVAEAFTPSFGVLGVSGLIALGFGAVLLFDAELPGFAMAPGVIAMAVLLLGLLLLVVLAAAVRAHRRRSTAGAAGLLGSHARVLRWNANRGQVQAQGETWQARADQPLAAGQSVRVTARDGLILTVEPLDPKP